jgi:hypothetical protein
MARGSRWATSGHRSTRGPHHFRGPSSLLHWKLALRGPVQLSRPAANGRKRQLVVDEVAEATAIRDAEPVVIVGNEHRKCIWSLAAGIIEIHERSTAIHRAADHARLFKAVPARRLQHEGPVRFSGSRTEGLRPIRRGSAETRENRGNIADIMLECLGGRFVLRSRAVRPEKGDDDSQRHADPKGGGLTHRRARANADVGVGKAHQATRGVFAEPVGTV